MDELIFYLEKSSPRTQGKLLTILFKQDKKPFNKKMALQILGEFTPKSSSVWAWFHLHGQMMLRVGNPGQIHFPLFWCHWATVSPYLWSGPAAFPLTSPETPDNRWGNHGDVDLPYDVRGRQRTPHLSRNTGNTLSQCHYWEVTALWPLRAPLQGQMPKACPSILPKASIMCSQPLDNGKHAQKKNLPNKLN